MVTLRLLELVNIANNIIETLDDGVIFNQENIFNTFVTLSEYKDENGATRIRCDIVVPK